MKRCQVCHNVTDDNATTCPRCGEASWATIASDSAAMTDDELDALTAPTPKKGKR